MNYLDRARKALAEAKGFYETHKGQGDTLTAAHRETFGRMLDEAETLSAQHRMSRLADSTDAARMMFSDKAAELYAFNEDRLPESLKGEPSRDTRIRLAGINRDARFAEELQLGRTNKWMTALEQGANKEELALVIGTDTKGGFWTPDYWERMIVTEWRKIEGVTQVTRPMITGDGNPVYIQQRTEIHAGSTAITSATDVSTYQVAERAASRSDIEPDYDRVALNVFKVLQKQVVSTELLEDSLVNVAAEVGSAAGQWFGELMEQAWTNGTGTGQPKGVFHDIQSGQEVNTAAAGNPTMIDLHSLIYGDKRLMSGSQDYSILANRGVWGAAVRDIGKEYLPWWGVDLSSEGRMMAFGYPVVFGTFIDPAITAGSNPIGFGNWNKYLRTRVVNTMRMTVSDIAESDTDDITYRFRLRYGSQLADSNQGVFLNISS